MHFFPSPAAKKTSKKPTKRSGIPGKGSHHPDYKPDAKGDDVLKGSRETEELLLALIKNDVKLVYKKIEEGADVNFSLARAYRSKEGYTPLMCACHRGRLEAAKALLRSVRIRSTRITSAI